MTRIPSINRHNIGSAATINGQLDDISPCGFNQPGYNRSNTQSQLKKPTLVHNKSAIPGEFNTHRAHNDGFQKVHTQLNLAANKAKKQSPHYISPSKSEAIRRAKLKSRAKTGQTIKDTNPHKLLLDNSNSPSDEYYETTKISPTSSYANSVYGKGIHVKSSQSCRNTVEDPSSAIAIPVNKL